MKAQVSEWKVETIINDKKVKASIGIHEYNVRSLIQIIKSPSGEKMQLEQLLDNNGDIHEISIETK